MFWSLAVMPAIINEKHEFGIQWIVRQIACYHL